MQQPKFDICVWRNTVGFQNVSQSFTLTSSNFQARSVVLKHVRVFLYVRTTLKENNMGEIFPFKHIKVALGG